MAKGDVRILRSAQFGDPGSRRFQVQSGAAATINPGELTLKTLGTQYVTAWTSNNNAKPVVGTDFLAGLSANTSTDTASANGTVDILPIIPGMVLGIAPNNAATFGLTPGSVSQTTYSALVGARVLLNTTSGGVQTILAADGSTHGLIVEDIDVTKIPNTVAFSVRQGANYFA